MKVRQMIEELSALEKEVGNVEVWITDGYECHNYEGLYKIEKFYDPHKERVVIDIGVGGCKV